MDPGGGLPGARARAGAVNAPAAAEETRGAPKLKVKEYSSIIAETVAATFDDGTKVAKVATETTTMLSAKELERVRRERGVLGAREDSRGRLADSFDYLVGFWVCGIINNLAYIVFLSAAEDLITGLSGAVLLADVFPGLLMKVATPLYLSGFTYTARVIAVASLASFAFLIVAFGGSRGLQMLGVVLASVAMGLGEVTHLSMAARFPASAVGGWSSGTGAAGVVGSGLWVVLRKGFKLSTRGALLLFVPLPSVMTASFYLLLRPHLQEEGAPVHGSQNKAPRAARAGGMDVRPPAGAAEAGDAASEESSVGGWEDMEMSDEFPGFSVESPAAGEGGGKQEEEVEEDEEDPEQLLLTPDSERGGGGGGGGYRARAGAAEGAGAGAGAGAGGLFTLEGKWRVVKPVLGSAMLPLFLVYLFEYIINLAMFLPLGFAIEGGRAGSPAAGRRLDASACGKYSTMLFLYQLGAFAARSSVWALPLPALWPLPVLQGANAVLGLGVLHAVGGSGSAAVPAFLVYAAVLWEGLLGGCAYVNAFTAVRRRVRGRAERELALGVTSLADTTGITLAACISLWLEGALLQGLGHARPTCGG